MKIKRIAQLCRKQGAATLLNYEDKSGYVQRRCLL